MLLLLHHSDRLINLKSHFCQSDLCCQFKNIAFDFSLLYLSKSLIIYYCIKAIELILEFLSSERNELCVYKSRRKGRFSMENIICEILILMLIKL